MVYDGSSRLEANYSQAKDLLPNLVTSLRWLEWDGLQADHQDQDLRAHLTSCGG